MRGEPTLAKIAPPQLREPYVRKRLMRLLDGASERPIIWVGGPAGSGKTTLVANWLEAGERPCVWYQVDDEDSDVASIFYYLGLAAGRLGRASLPAYRPDPPGALAAFARRFFAALFAAVPPRTTLVLDNLQNAPPGSSWPELLRRALDVIPPERTVVLISRDTPTPDLARAIVNGRVAVVGWRDLRLTETEARGLVRRGGRRPDAELLGQLYRQTDGWAAGLVLLAELGAIEAAAVAGPPLEVGAQALFDYFATEAFERVDAGTQDFVLRTAFLPTMTPALAARLLAACEPPSGRARPSVAHADRVLARLSRANFFTERRLSRSSVVYQYHPLFRHFLLERVAATLPLDEIEAIRRTAGQLLVEDGRHEDAYELLRTAGDWDTCARLIADKAPALLGQGRVRTLEAWLLALPEEVSADPWLRYYRAVCCLGSAPGRSLTLLEGAFADFRARADVPGACLTCAAALQAVVHEANDLAPMDIWLARLLELERAGLPALSPEIEVRLALGKCLALAWRQPGHPDGAAWVAQAQDIFRRAGDDGTAALMAGFLALYLTLRGDVARSAAVLEPLRARERHADPLVATTVLLSDGLRLWMAGEHELTLRLVKRGIELGNENGVLVWNDLFHTLGVSAALALGDRAAARPFLTQMGQSLTARASVFATGIHAYNSAWAAVVGGDAGRGAAFAEASMVNADIVGYPIARILARTALAQVYLTTGRRAEAAMRLAEARRLAEETESRFLLYSCLLIEADLALLTDEQQALAPLALALALGREHGLMTTFFLLRDRMTRLCGLALRAGVEIAHVRELVRRLALRSDEAGADWPVTFQVRTLGRFEITRDGVPLPLSMKGPSMPLRLLAALIAPGGKPLHELDLVSDLWPDADGDAARRVFDTTLYRLRRLLGRPDAVRIEQGHVRLDRSIWWVDLWALDEELRTIERGHGTGESDAAYEERLFGLYRGRFLESYDEVAATRERTHARVVRGLLELAARHERFGRLEQACRLYEHGLDLDETETTFYERLIACLVRRGLRADALRLFTRGERTLQRHGLALAPETKSLGRSLRGLGAVREM
jgi:ATP/maltotriose-dependent transcriptional regulator MalT/DNA-binding SARP family transcriptional activator